MKQVGDKAVLDQMRLNFFLNVYGMWEITFSGYTNDMAHTEFVRLHICMNEVCDKLNRSFQVNELVFQSDKTNCMKFAVMNKTCINLKKSFYNK